MAPQRSLLITAVLGIAVFLCAAVVRFQYLNEYSFDGAPEDAVWQVQGPRPTIQPPRSTEVDRLEVNLLQHGVPDGFKCLPPLGPKADEDTAQVGPLFPLFRTGLRWLADNYRDLGMTPHALLKMTQLLLGSLTALLYFIVALRAFGGNLFVALLAGLAVSVYPFWVMNTAEVEDGVLVSFLLAWSLALGIRVSQRGGVIRSYLFGLILAALALTRAALLPFTIVVQLWFFLRCRQVPLGGLCAILTVLGYATGMAPWLLRNQQVFGEPVPVVTTAWYHVWIGNNSATDGADYNPSMAKRLSPELVKRLEETPQPDRYELLAPEVLREVVDQPTETVKRRIKAAMQFFFGVNRLKAGAVFSPAAANVTPPAWLGSVLIGTLLGTYLLALLGWRWSYAWRSSTTLFALALIWIPLPYILSHSGALHTSRLPLDGVFITLALVGLLGLIPGLSRQLLAGETQPQR